jgi:hypothetical protein
MTTTTSEGSTCIGTSEPFNATAGQAVQIPVTILCGNVVGPGGGSASLTITGTVVPGDNCPTLTASQISPAVASASGGQINVVAAVSDADSGDTLSLAWSATAGSFLDPSAAMTKYVCAVAGQQTISLAISDNHTPTPCIVNVTWPPVTCQ